LNQLILIDLILSIISCSIKLTNQQTKQFSLKNTGSSAATVAAALFIIPATVILLPPSYKLSLSAI
jgi:hypothetical protein